MLKSNIFRKYFMICSTCVLVSILVLGVILVMFASSYFEGDKYEMMGRYVSQAVNLTAENHVRSGDRIYIDKNQVATTYQVVSKAIGAEVYLTNPNGEILYFADVGVDEAKRVRLLSDRIPETIRSMLLSNGIYEETGVMGGLYDSPRYTVGMPVLVEGQTIGYVFASSSAQDLMSFLNELIKMFAISAVVVLLLASILIYFITARMVKPLKLMLKATQSFSQGDFTVRVPVSGYDEIGQLSMAFNNMASTLATTETSRRTFVANVSHELKTPMTTISGFVDGILDGTVPEEKRDQYLEIVSNECKRLSRLVRSMLDSARIEAGELVLHPILFDISEIMRQTIFTFEQSIEEKQLEIRGLDTDKVMVLADRDLMHQVVYNLVENAVKFVDMNGYIAVSYRVGTKMTHIAIQNSGEGIEREEAARLFDRFYKSDRSRSLNASGVGLGLHIVRTIVQYHNGEVGVRSVPGEYTEFEISIPNSPSSMAKGASK